MKILLSLPLLPFLALGVQAQTTLDLVTDGPIAAYSVNALEGAFDGTANGTAISSLNLSARTSQGDYASATTIAYKTASYQGSAGFNFFQRACARGATTTVAGTSASASGSSAQHGPQAILATFTSAPGTAGKLVLSFRANPGTTGTVAGSIDVDADGTIEASATQSSRHEIPYTFGASGSVQVRVVSENRVTGSGNSGDFQSSWTEMWVGFQPDLTASCTITPYGQGCQGASLSGGEMVLGRDRVVTLLASGAFASSPVLFLTGTQSLNVPLPGGCTWLATAEGIDIVNADANGQATFTWIVPVTATGTSYHQVLPITLVGGALQLSASNALRIECRT